MSPFLISIVLGFYLIHTCSSRTCQCLYFNQGDCDRNTECKWFPDNTICRSIQWVFCEEDEKCKAEREQRKINREPEPDFDWPFDCPEWYNEDDIVTETTQVTVTQPHTTEKATEPGTTQLSCEAMGVLNGETCACADFSACKGLGCEPGPQVSCDNGGICCCGQCADTGPPPPKGPPTNGQPPPEQPPPTGGQPPPEQTPQGGNGGDKGKKKKKKKKKKAKSSSTSVAPFNGMNEEQPPPPPPPNDEQQPPPPPPPPSNLMHEMDLRGDMDESIRFGYIEWIASLVVCIGLICVGVLCHRKAEGEYKALGSEEYRYKYSTFEHV
eukprot:93802_1